MLCMYMCTGVRAHRCVGARVCAPARTHQHPDLHLRETLLEQIEWCKQRKMKKQKETLLLVLQVVFGAHTCQGMSVQLAAAEPGRKGSRTRERKREEETRSFMEILERACNAHLYV